MGAHIGFKYDDGLGREDDDRLTELEKEISAILQESDVPAESLVTTVAVAPRSKMRVACE